jgi:hypothetical protein
MANGHYIRVPGPLWKITQAGSFVARRKEIKAMYHGYTESEEKIEARKRRILGAGTRSEDQPAHERWKAQDAAIRKWLMQRFLIFAILLPAGSFLGGLIGELIQALWR